MKNILIDLSGKISETSVSILREILEREAKSIQGHKIAMDVLQSDSYRNQSYERVVEYFNALLEGLAEQKG